MDPNAALAVRAAIGIAVVWTVYKLAIRHLGERPRDDLRLADAPKGLGIGLLVGAALFSAVVGVAAIADVYNIVGKGGTSDLIRLAIGIAIIPGFMEELLFRGILFRWIEELAGSWVALLITSALFGLGHFYNPMDSFSSSPSRGSRCVARRCLHADAQSVDGDRLHAAWNFTQGGFSTCRFRGPIRWPVRGAIVGAGVAVRRRVRVGSVVIALVLRLQRGSRWSSWRSSAAN